ncbi:MAG: TonB-dependent receptor [Candidatus Omnitrophota bacterium]|nr:TonB-dependent receptor [Candidatus Omnitrophota bacterium]
MKKLLLLLAFMLIATSAVAEEKKDESMLRKLLETAISPVETVLGPITDLGKIVVAPNKIEEKMGSSSQSITSINVSDASRIGEIKVEEGLRDVPSLDVVETGFNGQTSVFMRGAASYQTLVMLDGIKLYDPMDPNGAFNFAHLTYDNLERVEVVRGAQSALYGSDAMGGLISMETKKAMDTFANASVEAGSYYTTNEAFDIGSYISRLHFTIGGSQYNSKGISQAEAKNNNQERDPYDRTVFSARLDYDFTDNLTAGGTFRYTLAHFKYDSFGIDYPNLHATHENYSFTQYVEQRLFDWWKYKISLGWMINLRKDFDDPFVGARSEYVRDKYYGKYFRADYQNTFNILDTDNIVVGYDYVEELGHSYYEYSVPGFSSISNMPKVTARNGAFYVENRFNFKDRLTATQGMRVDHHSYAGTHVTYKIDGSYLLPTATKIRGVYATGFKAPTLYQLNVPAIPAEFWGGGAFGGGNPNLKPETSDSYEYGLDQYMLGEKIIASVVYFHNRFKNLINTTTSNDGLFNTTQYANTGKAYTYGVESELKFKPYDKINGSLSYTWMKTKDMSTDSELLRRAGNKLRLQVNWKVFPRFETDLIVRYTGPRMDSGQNKLKQYTTTDVTFNYELNKTFTIFTRIDNLFNVHYQEVRLNGEPGINVYGGVKAKF